MSRCTKLCSSFFSMDLYSGKTMLKPNTAFHRYLILDHEYSKDYITDPNSTYEEDGLTFFKVIESYEFFEGVSLLTLDSQLNLQIGDTLIDENGNLHVVSAFGMLNMRQSNFPDWYLKLTHVQINSDPRTIGNYVAHLKENVL